MNKISHQIGSDWVKHSYPQVFCREPMQNGIERIVTGISDENVDLFINLIRCIDEPIMILYVLHTSRGEGKAGRYQSPELSLKQVMDFISAYSEYLCADSRFDIWAHSQNSNATIVWDRHNIIYGYGTIECFESELFKMDFVKTDSVPDIPVPHTHHYHKEFDAEAKALLEYYDWSFSELRQEDIQRKT